MYNNDMIRIFIVTVLLVATVCASGCGTTKQQRKEPAQLYKEGIEKLEGKDSFFADYEGAEGAFEEIKRRYSFTIFAPLAELRLADINFEREEYQDAIANYDEFIKMHPGHKEVPYAIYRKGLSYFEQIGGNDRDLTPPEAALAVFESLASRYPESSYAKEVSAKIDICKVTLAENEFYVGEFYFKKKSYKAAANRFNAALEKFPGYGPKEAAMLYMAKSYLGTAEKEKAKNILNRLISAFPASKEAEEAKNLLSKYFNEAKEYPDE